jgi:hypothetical protein
MSGGRGAGVFALRFARSTKLAAAILHPDPPQDGYEDPRRATDVLSLTNSNWFKRAERVAPSRASWSTQGGSRFCA